MQKSSVEPEIFPTFQHKVERVPHFARISEVRHIYLAVFLLDMKNLTNHSPPPPGKPKNPRIL